MVSDVVFIDCFTVAGIWKSRKSHKIAMSHSLLMLAITCSTKEKSFGQILEFL